MTIRHLKIFIKVADCGTMSQAAKELYISQPSVSQAIGEIETYYGVKLFERLTQKLFLTDSGRQLLPYARHVIDSFQTMEQMMKQAGEEPIIKLGASVSVGSCLIPLLLEKIGEKKKLELEINNTSIIEEKILKSQLDLAIVEGTVRSNEVVKIPLCQDELVIVVGPNHPFYRMDMIKLEDLQGMTMISREDGSSTRNQYEQLLNESGIEIYQKMKSTNTEAIKNIVKQGKELAILSRMLVEPEIQAEELKILKVEDKKVIREIQLIYHQNKYIHESLANLIEECKQMFIEH